MDPQLSDINAKEKKITPEPGVVVPSHAVADPDAMVVESLYTSIADRAVLRAKRPEDVASFA